MKQVFTIVALLFTLISFNSCTYRLIDFTTISSKNVTFNLPETAKSHRVKGEDYVTVFLGIPFGVPNLKEATDQAIEQAGGDFDALIDGVVYQKRKWYFLFGKYGYEVEGTPIKSKYIGSNVQMVNHERINVIPVQNVAPIVPAYTEPPTSTVNTTVVSQSSGNQNNAKGKMDMIFRKDGTVIQGKVIEITSTEIMYKKVNNLEGPSFRIKTIEIKYIQYPNGEKEMF